MNQISESINNIFGPAMRAIFAPTNAMFDAIPEDAAVIVAKASAVSLFIAAMIWVFTLRKEYVNLDAPGKSPWFDLRFWTILSMLPHVIVYLWF